MLFDNDCSKNMLISHMFFLQMIFQFINKQLWGLENVEGPSWKRYFYLLENLAMVKSYNICMELDDANEIFVELFTIFFNIIK